MKHTFKRILALTLLVVLLLPMFASCNTEPADTTTMGDTTTSTTTTGTPSGPTVKLELESITDLASYTIVYAEASGSDVIEAAEELAALIASRTGITLPVVSDRLEIGASVPTDTKEILVGATNRTESAVSSALRYDDYYLTYTDGRLAIMGGSDEAVIVALGFAADTLVSDAGLAYVKGDHFVPADYPIPEMTLSGRPISDYVIVRDEENAAMAKYLATLIRQYTGHVIPIHTDIEAEVPYEILIGDTGRAATSTLPTTLQYVVEAVGTKVALYGSGQDAGYRAALRFAKKYLDGKSVAITVQREALDNAMVGLYQLNIPDTFSTITLENEENTTGVFERFLIAKAELPEEVTVLSRFDIKDYPLSAQRKEIYIAPNGDDDGLGTIGDPLATLKEALTRVGAGGGVIWVRGGYYEVDDVAVITNEFSGTVKAPLFIKAYADEEPVFTTYKTIETDWFMSIEQDDPLYDRFDEDVDKDEIFYVDLAEHGFTLDDITEIVGSGPNYDTNGDGKKMETRFGVTPVVLIAGQEYELCRYPNADEEPLSYAYAYEMGRVTASTGSEIYYPWLEYCATFGINPQEYIPWAITLGTRTPNEYKAGVACEDTEDWDRYAPILEWVDTGNIWYYGRPYSDWDVGNYHVHVGQQTDEDGNLTGEVAHYGSNPKDYAIISTMTCSYGARTTSKANHAHYFYLYNAIEALDIPGEWFIDTQSEGLRMYLYPTDEFYGEDTITYTGNYSGDVIKLEKQVSNVIIDGLTFKGVGGTAINSLSYNTNSYENIVIQNCTFSNMGASAIAIRGGTQKKVAIIYNESSQTHGHMFTMSTNEAYGLKISHNVIQNNFFHSPMANNQEAIAVGGCRLVVSHNLLHNTNISNGGPSYENVFEYNFLVGGSEDVGDGGQIYQYGLYTRGNHIRYNIFHGLNFSGNNIYNDGMCSGNYSYYNICSTLTGYRTTVQKSFYVSTGHNNVCYNNIIINRSAERVISNLVLNESVEMPNNTNVEYFDKELGKKVTIKRNTGDCGMYESTLFFTDLRDDGYNNGRSEDSASYSWDDLYRAGAGLYTGNRTNAFIDLEMMEKRFPNWMETMRGAQALFDKMDAMDEEAMRTGDETKAYNRRRDVVAMQEAYAARVDELIAEGKTSVEANNIAWSEGLGYNEDFYRQPAYNLYKNNVISGGDSDWYYDTNINGEYGDSRNDFVYSDYLSNRGGLLDDGTAAPSANDPNSTDMRIIETNVYFPDYNDVFYEVDPEEDPRETVYYYPDYGLLDGVLQTIQETIPDFYELEWLMWEAGLKEIK